MDVGDFGLRLGQESYEEPSQITLGVLKHQAGVGKVLGEQPRQQRRPLLGARWSSDRTPPGLGRSDDSGMVCLERRAACESSPRLCRHWVSVAPGQVRWGGV